MEPTLTSKYLVTSTLRQLASINTNSEINTEYIQHHPTPSNSAPKFSTTNLLKTLPEPSATFAKSALLTLHFLFPFDFLPALDLIDRKLITKLTHSPIEPDTDPKPADRPSFTTFYVQSASALTSSSSSSSSTRRSKTGRFGNRNYAATRIRYEVRLDSWNCTCPAFAAASLKLILSTSTKTAADDHFERPDADTAAPVPLVGGTLTKHDVQIPACKHILAAALCEAAPGLFGSGMTTRDVSVSEMAAWAAGWGEA